MKLRWDFRRIDGFGAIRDFSAGRFVQPLERRDIWIFVREANLQLAGILVLNKPVEPRPRATRSRAEVDQAIRSRSFEGFAQTRGGGLIDSSKIQSELQTVSDVIPKELGKPRLLMKFRKADAPQGELQDATRRSSCLFGLRSTLVNRSPETIRARLRRRYRSRHFPFHQVASNATDLLSRAARFCCLPHCAWQTSLNPLHT